MVNVVVLKRDCVLSASQVCCPVVVAVARRRPVGLAFDEVVRDRDACVLAVASHNELTADERYLSISLATRTLGSHEAAWTSLYLEMIDPDVRGSVKSDGITFPNVLRCIAHARK